MPHPPRVVIPENPGELFKLAGLINAHGESLGDKSPLNLLEGPPTWKGAGPEIIEAIQIQVEVDDLERKLKVLYGRRDPLFAKYTALARNSRDMLLGIYSANPRKLGEFGYDVKTTEASKLPPTPPKS